MLKQKKAGHVATLDGLRGIAALAVVSMHMSMDTPLQRFPYRSYLAVDFFFVLSGFVVAEAYEARILNGLSFLSFARIRIIRLYPLILLGVVVEFVVQVVPHVYLSAPHIRIDNLSAYLRPFYLGALLIPYWGIYGGGLIFPIDPPVWSLMFEVLVNFFYAAIVRILSVATLLVMVAIGSVVLYKTAVKNNGLDAGFSLASIWGGAARVWFSFFCGVLICRLMNAERVRKLPKIPAPVLLGILLLTLSIPPTPWGWLLDFALVLLIYPAIVILSLTDTISPRWRRWSLFAGALSYPVYILHKPISGQLWPLVMSLPQVRALRGGMILVPWTCVLLLVLAGSYVAMRLYDVPVRRWLNRREHRPELARKF